MGSVVGVLLQIGLSPVKMEDLHGFAGGEAGLAPVETLDTAVLTSLGGDVDQLGVAQMDGQLPLFKREGDVEAIVVPGDLRVYGIGIQPGTRSGQVTPRTWG